MTVTINTLGPNSRQLVIEGETGPLGIIDAVNTSLVALGWTLFDSISSGANNCLVTKVYSALCDDADRSGPSTKYMILRYDTPKQFWYVTCCESWNNTTHVPTNECFVNGRCTPLPFQYDYCNLYVYASVRYAVFLGSVLSELSAWQGIFEFEREAPEDLATDVPCFGWGSQYSMGSVWAICDRNDISYASWGPVPHVFSVPRTKSGATGFAAMKTLAFVTSYGQFPPHVVYAPHYTSNSNGVINTNTDINNGHLASFGKGLLYRWDNTKNVASSIKLVENSSSYACPSGRFHGITLLSQKVTANTLDSVSIPLNTDGFFDNTGTPTDHSLLGLSGGWTSNLAKATGNLALAQTYAANPSGFAIYDMVIVSGRYLYINTSGGFIKLDVASGTPILLDSLVGRGMVFDGYKYVYIATTSGISRLDTTNDTFTHLASGTSGHVSIAIDDLYVYAGHTTASTTPKVSIISRDTFTLASTYTASSIADSLTLACLDTADYAGLCFAAALHATQTTSVSNKLHRITGATGTGTSIVPSIAIKPSSTYGCMYWDGEQLVLISGVNGATNVSTALTSLNSTTGTAVGSGSGNLSITTARGIANQGKVVPFRGHLLLPICTSLNWAPLYSNRFSMFQSDDVTKMGVLISGSNNLNTGVLAAPTTMCTDGCNLYSGYVATSVERLIGLNVSKNFNNNQCALLAIPK